MNNKSSRPFPGALLNPTIDPIFKSLFTQNSKTSNGALKAFLSAIFSEPVDNIKLLPNELPIQSVKDKQCIFDLTCTLKESNQVINIEMQGRNTTNSFDNRSEYYAAHLLNHFVSKGTKWNQVPKAYMISVLNFIYSSKKNDGILNYCMKNQNNDTLKSERLHIIYLELPKFKKTKDYPTNELTPIQRWAKFFLYVNNKEKQDFIKKLADEDGGIKMALETLTEISQNDAEWWAETLYLDQIITENTIKDEARIKGYEEGHSEGFTIGHAEGLAEGHAEGLVKGHAEGHAEGKSEILKAMLKNGATIEQIKTFTGLSEEEILKLTS